MNGNYTTRYIGSGSATVVSVLGRLSEPCPHDDLFGGQPQRLPGPAVGTRPHGDFPSVPGLLSEQPCLCNPAWPGRFSPSTSCSTWPWPRSSTVPGSVLFTEFSPYNSSRPRPKTTEDASLRPSDPYSAARPFMGLAEPNPTLSRHPVPTQPIQLAAAYTSGTTRSILGSKSCSRNSSGSGYPACWATVLGTPASNCATGPEFYCDSVPFICCSSVPNQPVRLASARQGHPARSNMDTKPYRDNVGRARSIPHATASVYRTPAPSEQARSFVRWVVQPQPDWTGRGPSESVCMAPTASSVGALSRVDLGKPLSNLLVHTVPAKSVLLATSPSGGTARSYVDTKSTHSNPCGRSAIQPAKLAATWPLCPFRPFIHRSIISRANGCNTTDALQSVQLAPSNRPNLPCKSTNIRCVPHRRCSRWTLCPTILDGKPSLSPNFYGNCSVLRGLSTVYRHRLLAEVA